MVMHTVRKADIRTPHCTFLVTGRRACVTSLPLVGGAASSFESGLVEVDTSWSSWVEVFAEVEA